MTVTVELTDYQRMRAYYLADQAVKCPKCGSGFGAECQSTGGGNYATVFTHKARRDRTAHWTDQQRQQYGELVWRQRCLPWEAPADHVAEAEATAKPIPAKAQKPVTPKGVRLSEQQAERIEIAAAHGGKTLGPLGHFSGDAAWRQTVLSLVAKGILAEGEVVDHGYSREYTLTDFGWQVYANHRLIIRNDAADHWAALNLQERR
ncbi:MULTISPECIES: hypothetical protein [unclassified Micromonospora]|uniref:zinc finger domain-containing protein n=1 Tax=unclassified Micromonospora TaxID=2617518 RepID=UPI003324B9B5